MHANKDPFFFFWLKDVLSEFVLPLGDPFPPLFGKHW